MSKKKTRPVGRPKNAIKRLPKTINFSEEAMGTLAELTEQYRNCAPGYISLSDRAVIEALIHYADREKLSFADLFGVPAGSDAP